MYGEGLKLPVEMIYDTALAREAFALAERWDSSRKEVDVSKLNFTEADISTFNANQSSTFPFCSFPSTPPPLHPFPRPPHSHLLLL